MLGRCARTPGVCGRRAAACSLARSGGAALRAAAVDAPQATSALSSVQIPEALRNNVVVLEAPNSSGEPATVYLVGVSHVSKVQADAVRQLVRVVRPDVVAVELCKDRTGLLVDDRLETQASNLWHVNRIIVEGLASYDESYPSAEELRKLIKTRPGVPVSMQDIEADVVTLLSTGLFKSVTPGAKSGTPNEAPEFGVLFGQDGTASLETVPPLAALRFSVAMRELPPVKAMSVRVDSSLEADAPDAAALDAVCADVVLECKDAGTRPLTALLRARARFGEVAGRPVAVAFRGVETGEVEATLKAAKPGDRPYLSGLEGGAINGEGFGIEPFRPKRPLTKLSEKMFLATSTLEALRAKARADAAAAPGGADAGGAGSDANAAAASAAKSASARQAPRTEFREWSAAEMASAKRADPAPSPTADLLRDVLVLSYAKAQADAGRAAGVERGAAWQAALQAASEVGTQQVLLVDRPTTVTERRLADAMLAECGPRLVGAATLVLGSIVAAVAANAPVGAEAGGVLAAAAAAATLVWPVAAPLAKVRQLARMSAEAIEDAVAQKAPLSGGASGRLFGEDALLEWPGAEGPLLAERDVFMAHAGAGAARGEPVVPAYVLDRVDGRLMWRLMQADGAREQASPRGFGDGAYVPLKDVRSVVQIVGTAHVPGIVAGWKAALADPTAVDDLLRSESGSGGGSP
uniref:TraB domain-containing protein n=1 Tax=Chlamydomonas euryale TaxID=1486919 RepID=A0A7R9VAT9_9CHLO|mmetsp:Transcript_26739/g.79418  ORF Transcript_26739/g.79418 Transcript_26739/m.79418 type:complete len:695 (+) Transcript_26739:140-2224(+)